MDINQLRYFRSVAKTEHFTRSAGELHITQPTLSKSIAALEKELGVRLFDRTGNSVRLNPYGEYLLRHVDQVFSILDSCTQKIDKLQEDDSGEIVFASNVPALVSGCIEQYMLTHPSIHLHQIQSTADQMKRMLESQAIDFAITFIPIDTQLIEWTPLITETHGIQLCRSHPLASKENVVLADFKNERFMMNNCNQDMTNLFISYCAEAGFYPDIFFEGDQPQLIAKLIASGHGISIAARTMMESINRRSIHAQPWDSEIIFKELSFPTCARTTGVARLRARTLPQAVDNFYGFLVNYFSQKQAPAV